MSETPALAFGFRVAKEFGELGMCEGTVESLAPGGDPSDEDDEDDVLWRVRYDDGDVEDYDLGDMTKYAISGPVAAAAQIYNIVGGAGAQ